MYELNLGQLVDKLPGRAVAVSVLPANDVSGLPPKMKIFATWGVVGCPQGDVATLIVEGDVSNFESMAAELLVKVSELDQLYKPKNLVGFEEQRGRLQ